MRLADHSRYRAALQVERRSVAGWTPLCSTFRGKSSLLRPGPRTPPPGRRGGYAWYSHRESWSSDTPAATVSFTLGYTDRSALYSWCGLARRPNDSYFDKLSRLLLAYGHRQNNNNSHKMEAYLVSYRWSLEDFFLDILHYNVDAKINEWKKCIICAHSRVSR